MVSAKKSNYSTNQITIDLSILIKEKEHYRNHTIDTL